MNAFYASAAVLIIFILIIVFMKMFSNRCDAKMPTSELVRSIVKNGARHLETARNSKSPLIKMINSNYAIACLKNAQMISSDDYIQSQCNVDIISLIQKAEMINDKAIKSVNAKGKFMKSDNITVAGCFA